MLERIEKRNRLLFCRNEEKDEFIYEIGTSLWNEFLLTLKG